MAEDPVKLTVTGISKSFGGVQAVKDISLTVLEGMIFAEVFLRTSWRNRVEFSTPAANRASFAVYVVWSKNSCSLPIVVFQ